MIKRWLLFIFLVASLPIYASSVSMGYEIIVNGQKNGNFTNYHVEIPINAPLTVGIVTADVFPKLNAPYDAWLELTSNTAGAVWLKDTFMAYPEAGDPGPVLPEHELIGPDDIFIYYDRPSYPGSWSPGLWFEVDLELYQPGTVTVDLWNHTTTEIIDTLTVTGYAVNPEPSTIALLLFGGLILRNRIS